MGLIVAEEEDENNENDNPNVTKSCNLGQSNAMQRIKEKTKDSEFARKERDKRRRKMIVD